MHRQSPSLRATRTDFLSITMNKFLKKKASDGPAANEDALHALSAPNSPGLKKSSTSRWKKNKKLPEVKPQLDFNAALPSTDDFRTSLIMPSLSTRFSMLREQDDPKSLLGKASDDSVLQPRRRSRMMDFGFAGTGLSDIAEVSSIHGSFRPPFAQADRGYSFASEEGYSSDVDLTSSSVMSRSRPGEGNNLFGGRQKIYKIPASGANSTRSLGKLVYEDDVGMSAFQKYRQREREVGGSIPRASDESQGFDFGIGQAEPGNRDYNGLDTLPNDSAKDLSHSPSLSSYDKKRSTTSSTARSEARSSTAATSVASQPTNSALPSPAQAPAATLTTILSPGVPDQAPMSAPLLDRSNTKARRLYEHGLDQHMQEQQTSALTRLNSIQRQRGFNGKSQSSMMHGTRSAGSLRDRSQSPAFGLSNRPSPAPSPLPQLNTFGSVKRGNSNTSSPILSGPQSPVDMEDNEVWTQALEPGDRGKATAMGAFNKPAQAFDEKQYLERQKALQRSASNAVVKEKGMPHAAGQISEHAQRSSPDLLNRARSPSASQKSETTRAYNVFQNAVNSFPSKPAAAAAAAAQPKPALPDTHRTFFGNISASEDEDEDDDSQFSSHYNDTGHGAYNSRWQPTQLQPVSEHPALRSQRSMASVKEEQEEQPSPTMRPDTLTARDDVDGKDAMDSPMIAYDHPQALNGMVHHLRQKSNQSSLYPNDDFEGDEKVPEVPGLSWNATKHHRYSHVLGAAMDDQSAHGSNYAVSNPWDLDEQSYGGGYQDSVGPLDEAPSANILKSRQSDASSAQRETSRDRSVRTREDSEVSVHQNGEPQAWQQELRTQHVREASTATQQERDAFANELAARRNAIKENIKSIVDRDTHSRGTSPNPSHFKGAFGMLRPKSSRESVVNAHDQPSKPLRVDPSARPPMPTAQHPAFKADGPGPSRDMDLVHAERFIASNRSRPPSSAKNRSRSNSTATNGRSRSRTGPYRDDLEKAMVEGYGSSAAAHTPDISPLPGASPDVGRLSDEDKNNYFDQRTRLGSSAGVSPITLAPNVYNPGRPVPVANPYSQHTTPPLSGSSPMVGSQPYMPIVPSSARPGGILRKKTISKHDISEPTLISSTSNVDTVDLPEGASLKNGMEDAPPIPPINPKRRTTRKIFGRDRSTSRPGGDYEVRATASDPALNAYPSPAPSDDFRFPHSNVIRMPKVSPSRDYDASPAVQHYRTGSPERSAPVPQRSVTAPLDGSMF